MAKKKKRVLKNSGSGIATGSGTVNFPQVGSQWSTSSSSIGAITTSNITTSSLGGQWVVSPSFSLTSTLLSTIKDLRNHLFTVEIGHYDTTFVSSILRGIEFRDDKLFISFFLDDKDTIREAFTEYHSFRLSYLNTKGEAEETYQIQTDPLAEAKYILPDVRHDLSDIPVWKLVWSPYTVTRVVKEDKND